jgi:hypothetical protein
MRASWAVVETNVKATEPAEGLRDGTPPSRRQAAGYQFGQHGPDGAFKASAQIHDEENETPEKRAEQSGFPIPASDKRVLRAG